LPCRIRDISAGGARLRVECSGWLPVGFDLHDSFSNVKRKVRVVWKKPTSVGVSIVGEELNVGQTGFGRRRS
jgi:hypothetical protein